MNDAGAKTSLRAHRLVLQAEALAKQLMTGYRHGRPGTAPRRAWEHPADLVALLAERPGEFSEAGQVKAMAMAWLHDVIEDGRKEDGRRFTANDLRSLVVGHDVPGREPYLDNSVVDGVVQLTHAEGTSKVSYYETLKDIDYIPKLVKCVDRICNLREGVNVFSPLRWDRYVLETRKYVLPLTNDLREETAGWLSDGLLAAMELRPAVRTLACRSPLCGTLRLWRPPPHAPASPARPSATPQWPPRPSRPSQPSPAYRRPSA